MRRDESVKVIPHQPTPVGVEGSGAGSHGPGKAAFWYIWEGPKERSQRRGAISAAFAQHDAGNTAMALLGRRTERASEVLRG